VRPLSLFVSVGEPSGPPKGGRLDGAGSLVASIGQCVCRHCYGDRSPVRKTALNARRLKPPLRSTTPHGCPVAKTRVVRGPGVSDDAVCVERSCTSSRGHAIGRKGSRLPALRSSQRQRQEPRRSAVTVRKRVEAGSGSSSRANRLPPLGSLQGERAHHSSWAPEEPDYAASSSRCHGDDLRPRRVQIQRGLLEAFPPERRWVLQQPEHDPDLW
jgi:hypothetical protein